MIDLDISISDPAWESACPDCAKAAGDAVDAVMAHSPVARDLILAGAVPEISLVLANDDLVQTLNREYRGMDKPTNVLSFAQLDEEDGWHAPKAPGPCPLGDLVLAYGVVVRESAEGGKPFRDHFIHLVVHGTLHLLGYDHQEDEAAEAMESLEIRIVGAMGIKNPYKSGGEPL